VILACPNLLLCSQGTTDDAKKRDGVIVSKHVFGPVDTNGFIVGDVESGRCLIIDPGIDSDEMLDTVRQREWNVDWILNTHGHWDHIYSNAQFIRETGGVLAIHAGDIDLLEALTDQCFWMGVDIGEPSPAPDRVLQNGDALTVGAMEFSVLHIPGHSPGGAAFYCEGEGTVFVGDALFAGSVGRSDLPGGNHAQLIASIRTKLLTLPGDTTAYCGHGPETTVEREKSSNPFLK